MKIEILIYQKGGMVFGIAFSTEINSQWAFCMTEKKTYPKFLWLLNEMVKRREKKSEFCISIML